MKKDIVRIPANLSPEESERLGILAANFKIRKGTLVTKITKQYIKQAEKENLDWPPSFQRYIGKTYVSANNIFD